MQAPGRSRNHPEKSVCLRRLGLLQHRNRHSPKLIEDYHLAQQMTPFDSHQAEDSCLKSISSAMTRRCSCSRGLIHQGRATCWRLSSGVLCSTFLQSPSRSFQSLSAVWGLITTTALTRHDMPEIVWSNGVFICTVDRNKSAGFSWLGSNGLTCCPSDTSIACMNLTLPLTRPLT
jgi:hypothetical protein